MWSRPASHAGGAVGGQAFPGEEAVARVAEGQDVWVEASCVMEVLAARVLLTIVLSELARLVEYQA